MPSILDVAIGTIFVFLLFSIVVTALNELVLTAFDKRADFLRLGLGELLRACPANVARVRKSVKWEDGTRLSDRPE